jgi:glycosyltransferase involved in cell wall biosynthesis
MPPPQVRFLHRALDAVGGAEVLLVDQARFFERAGADVRVRTLVYDPQKWDERLAGLPVDAWHRVAGDRRPRLTRTLGRRRLRWLLHDLAGTDVALVHGFPLSAALGAAEGPQARVWHCLEAPRWLHPEAANPFLAANVERAPLRHGPHYYRTSLASPVGAWPLLGRRRPSQVAADCAGVLGLSAVWALSDYTKQSVQRIYPRASAEVLPPIVRFPEHVSAKGPLARDGLRILCASRLEWLKNLDTLIEGFSRYRQRTDPRATLSIVGTGPALASLKELANAFGVASGVRFHGFLSDPELAELSAASDVFACVPLDEPFGLVFPEAMARGLLVLGPDHGGPAEILEQGKFGEVVDPLEPDAIAVGLARIRRLPDAEVEKRRTLAAAACRARYAESVVGARMLELLRGLGIALPGSAA